MFLDAVYRGVGKGSSRAMTIRARDRRLAAIVLSVTLGGIARRAAARQGRRRTPRTPRRWRPPTSPATGSAVITEDWRFRMVTPPKGDFASIPLNDAGQKAANAWDPARRTSPPGEQCKAFGAGGADAHADPAARLVAGRHHAEARNRQRPAGAPLPVRRTGAGHERCAAVAGSLRRAVGDVAGGSGACAPAGAAVAEAAAAAANRPAAERVA